MQQLSDVENPSFLLLIKYYYNDKTNCRGDKLSRTKLVKVRFRGSFGHFLALDIRRMYDFAIEYILCDWDRSFNENVHTIISFISFIGNTNPISSGRQSILGNKYYEG